MHTYIQEFIQTLDPKKQYTLEEFQAQIMPQLEKMFVQNAWN